jgi:cobalt/nickel transport system ATP-binding protein
MLFSAQDIVYGYPGHLALRGVTLDIAAAERVALLGANGSGKSTLLRVLSGLYVAGRGCVRYEGRELTEEILDQDEFTCAFRQDVGLLFQDSDAQLFNATVTDEIAFGPLHLGWAATDVSRVVEEMLTRFRLTELRHRPPYQLSGGEKKRVALASILAVDPRVLLLDEPTAGLDPRSQQELFGWLMALPRDKTLVLATHDLWAVEALATRAVVLDQGRVVADGPASDLLRDRALLQRANLVRTEEAIRPPVWYG